MVIFAIIGLAVFIFIKSKVEMSKNVKGEDEFWVALIIFAVIIGLILGIANMF